MKGPDVKIFLSKATVDGGVQTNPNLSLGGFRSSTELLNKKNAVKPAPATIAGVTINFASVANVDGNGTLTYTAATKELQWTPPGGTIGTAVAFTVNATKVIYGSDISMFVEVTVTFASLPVANQTDTIAINKKSASAPVTITGVRINWASLQNDNASGTLTYTAATKELQWTPPGGTIGAPVAFTVNGTNVLEGGNNKLKSIEVTVTTASLPVANASEPIAISSAVGSLLNNAFDDVSSAEASAGDTEYRAFLIKNTHDTETLNSPIRIWIPQNTPAAGDTFEIAIEAPSAQPTGSIQSIANESTAPVGLTFSAPTTEATGILLPISLAAGQIYGLWQKRIVTAGASALSNNFVMIAISGDIGNLEN